MSAAEAVFGTDLSRLERIIEIQAAGYNNSSNTTTRFTAPAASLPSTPISHADSIAIAPYMESQRSTTANAQYVWQYGYGTDAEKQVALE